MHVWKCLWCLENYNYCGHLHTLSVKPTRCNGIWAWIKTCLWRIRKFHWMVMRAHVNSRLKIGRDEELGDGWMQGTFSLWWMHFCCMDRRLHNRGSKHTGSHKARCVWRIYEPHLWRSRCYTVTHCTGNVLTNTRPQQLCWGDQEMENAIYMSCAVGD